MKLEEALTFDDVLIRPGYSSILPRDVSTNTYFSREIKINIIPWILENKPKISPEINARIEMAKKITNDQVDEALNFRTTLIEEIDKSLPKGIIALFPTTPFSSPKSGQSDEQLGSYRKKLMEFTSIAGMTARPQISMPKFKDNTGPIGISLLGWQYSDEILLEKLMYL